MCDEANLLTCTAYAYCHVIQTPSFIYQPYEPRVLPWVRPIHHYLDSPIESNKNIFRPVPIKDPNNISVSDDTTTTVSLSLGPRSCGDGKCSTPESYKNNQSLESTGMMDSDTLIDSELDKWEVWDESESTGMDSDTMLQKHRSPDEKDGDQKIDYIPFIDTELDKWEEWNESEFEENSEDKSELCFSTSDTSKKKSRSSSSSSSAVFELSVTPLPVYSEKDIDHNDEVVSGVNNLKTMLFNCDYDSSSSEKDVPQSTTSSTTVNSSTMENVAVPSFAEDDHPIYMIDSGFSKEKYGAKYTTTDIGDKMEVGRFYEIYISEVHNPYKFWFQLADEMSIRVDEMSTPVDEMQENLNSYYNLTTTYDSEDMINKSHIKKGYACAALYHNIWHRAEILDEPLHETVKVFFVDYGTIDKVEITDLRYLLDSFCITPKLCYRGTLDLVKPISYRWNVYATHFFLNLVADRKLVTGVSEIDHKSNSVRLNLMDSERGIYISRKLVSDGFAYPDDPSDRYQVHIADAVPTFDSLEKGQHPSYDEIVALLQRGYDIERDVQSKIIDGIDCYIPQHISDAETLQRAENFKQRREEAKLLAKQKDRKMFLLIFDDKILKNPFLNGIDN